MPTANLTPEQMTARIAELEGQLATSTAAQSNFDKKLAGELAKHGVRPSAIATNPGSRPGTAHAEGCLTSLCARVKSGEMSAEQANAERPKPEPSVWVYQGSGPSVRPTVIA